MQKLVLMVCLMMSASALAHRPVCHPSLRHRTPEQVLASHFENLATGNFEAERCNYAEDAVVISDGGITTGVDDIILSLQGFGSLFGGQVPQLNEEIIVRILDRRTHMARTLFSITTPCIDIPDGTDTYIIRDGRIQSQTAHGFPVFKCGPPPPPPAP